MQDLLVVEDKASLRAMLRKTLVAAGYPVDEAGSGPEAISRLARRRFPLGRLAARSGHHQSQPPKAARRPHPTHQ